MPGKAGGVRTRHTTRRLTSSPIIRASRSSWKAARPFHFITSGIEEALDKAKAAAGDKDVKIGGGVATVRRYLQAGLIDELHFAVAPVVLGKGEAMFSGIDLPDLGFRVTEHVASEHATHIVLAK